jgi:hypothetical protein
MPGRFAFDVASSQDFVPCSHCGSAETCESTFNIRHSHALARVVEIRGIAARRLAVQFNSDDVAEARWRPPIPRNGLAAIAEETRCRRQRPG